MSDHKEKIKVAVRIRPLSYTDIQLSHQKLNFTTEIHPGEKKNELFLRKMDVESLEHRFSFDSCFWPPEEHGEKGIGEYATDTKIIFDDIGKEILLHAWEGYNIAVLAYGQSGSGKSWNLWGDGSVKGLLFYLSSEMYKNIKEKDKRQLQSKDSLPEVKFSMVDIYNECRVDLFVDHTVHYARKEFFRSRMEFNKGINVTSSEELMQKFEEGMTNRAKYYNSMNLQSENGYTCVAMTLTQRKKNGKGDEVRISSVINLIELPGKYKILHSLSTTEEVSKESNLVSLDKCMKILMNEEKNAQQIQNHIGDSISANYLYKAFVENSINFLIANISQDSEDYDVTLSTLLFANEVQTLCTRPRICEETVQKYIRDIRNENDWLKKLISNETALVEQIQLSKLDLQTVNKEEIKKQWTETIKMQIKENEREIKGMSLTSEDKLKQGKLDRSVDKALLKKFESDKKQKPHFTNLHSDPQINGRLVHFIAPGNSVISGVSGNKDKEYFIHMPGIGTEDYHAAVTYFPRENRTTLKPCFSRCRIRINGKTVCNDMSLSHYDRLTIGSGQIWLFQNPKEQNSAKIPTKVTYQMAVEENFNHETIDWIGNLGSQKLSCVKKLIAIVEDANIMSKNLDRKVRFEIVLCSHENKDRDTEFFKTHESVLLPEEHVQILFKDTKLGFCNIWSVEKFLRRVDHMKHLYNQYHKLQTDSDEAGNVDDDPFYESADVEIVIGHAMIPLKPLAYLIEYHKCFDIIDITDEKIGVIEMSIAPCDISGIDYVGSSNVFHQDPYELIGNSLHAKFKILNCDNIFPKYKNIYCRYEIGTKKLMLKEKCDCFANNHKFDHEQILTFESISKEVINLLLDGNILVKMYGKPNYSSYFDGIQKSTSTSASISTAIAKSRRNDFNKTVQNDVDFIITQKLESRQKEKFKSLQLLIQQTENIGLENIPINVIKSVTNCSNKLKADEIIDIFIEERSPNLQIVEEKENPHHTKTCTIQ